MLYPHADQEQRQEGSEPEGAQTTQKKVGPDEAGMAALMAAAREKYGLPAGPDRKTPETDVEARALLDQYKAAWNFLDRKVSGGMLLTPAVAEQEVELSSRPLLKIGDAVEVFRRAAKSYAERPICSLCGITEFATDVLHLHIHMVNNCLMYFANQICRLFDQSGRLKSREGYLAYQAPSGKNSADAHRRIGFWLFDAFERFSKVPGLSLPPSICMQRPMQGLEAGQCCQILAYAGQWLPALCGMLDVEGLRQCEYVKPAERRLFDLMHAWLSSLCVVLKIVRHWEAIKYRKILVEYLGRLIRVMHTCTVQIKKYSVRCYDHEIFVHLLDELDSKKSLIKYACWVTEHMNVAWRDTLQHHTTRGGGCAGADGTVMSANRQAFYRMSLIYSGVVDQCLASMGLKVYWYHTKVVDSEAAAGEVVCADD